MSDLSNLQTVVLAKLNSRVEDLDVSPGAYEFDFCVRIQGRAVRAADTEATPTSRALTLETLALFIKRSGLQREAAINILMEVMRDSVQLGSDQKTALLEITGVAEARDRLAREMAKLPKVSRKGSFSFKEITVEPVSNKQKHRSADKA